MDILTKRIAFEIIIGIIAVSVELSAFMGMVR